MQSGAPTPASILDALFGAVPAALALIDAELRLTRVTPRFAALLERPADGLVGQLLQDAGLLAPSVAAVRAVLADGRAIVDGPFAFSPVRGADGGVQGVLAVFAGDPGLDDPHEGVGRLAGGVAHDFNNLLTTIMGHTDVLLSDMAPTDHRRSAVESIRRAGQRAVTVTRQLLAVGQRQVLRPQVLEVDVFLEGVTPVVKRALPSTVRLAVQRGAGRAAVRVDPGPLQEVVLALVANAVDAMPRGGSITITSSVVDAGGPVGEVVVAVTDTGVGMPPDVLARCFEPFFSTKRREGAGLSLASVLGIVRQSGGRVPVLSEVGRGTTFEVRLPLSGGMRDVPPAPSSGHLPVAPKGNETILVVEDDDSVRDLVHAILEDKGYRVIEAGTGEAALELADAYPGQIHLVLTDVILPGLRGGEVRARILERRPDTKALYMSGYPGADMIRQGVLEAGAPLLSKPFTPAALAREVRAVLDGTR